MQVDWITVAAQIVNFLILVWLLRKFLYGPVVRAMQRREQRIADRLHEAGRKEKEAEEEARRFREQQEELRRRQDQMLEDARGAAEEERKALERQAREEVESKKRAWLAQLEAEREAFLRDMKSYAAEQFYALARRALDGLAGAELEEQIALSFAKQFEGLDEDAVRKLSRAAAEAGEIVIRSRFVLSPNAKRHLTKAVHARLGEDIGITYGTDADLGCGIELKAGGQVLSWNMAEFLDGFAESLGGRLSQAQDWPRQASGA